MTKTRKPSTPGEILREEFMKPNNLTIIQLAELANTHRNTIQLILLDRAGISVAMAFKLAKVFNTSHDFWLNLQRSVDVWEAINNPVLKAELDQVKPFELTEDEKHNV